MSRITPALLNNERVRSEYYEHKIIYEILNESPKTQDSKIKSILLSDRCRQHLSLGPGEENVFSITDFSERELDINESNKLIRVIRDELGARFNEIAKYVTPVTESATLVHLKSGFINLHEAYIKNLMKKLGILEEMLHKRLEKAPEVFKQKAEEYEIKTKINQVRLALIKEKMKHAVYKETSLSGRAYKQLFADIMEQQEVCQEEIGKLENLEKDFNQVQCKEFHEILKSYIVYKNRIEQGKRQHL